MRRTIPALCLFLLIPSARDARAQGRTVDLAYPVAGKDRQTILYVPAGLGAKPPLVYVIHGFNMSGMQQMQLTRMNAVADTGKFIVAYPNALRNGSNQQAWDMTGPDDYAYLLSLIDTAAGRYGIDRDRVYVSGFSMGGFLSFNLGCRYADRIAAIAPVSGLLNQECALKRPLPTLFTYGTNEGFDVKGFVRSGEEWARLNGCGPTPAITRPYPPANPNSVVTRLAYPDCDGGSEVIIDTVKGGTHEWPMDTRTKVNNSVEVWDFFKRFSLRSATRAGATGPGRARATLAYERGTLGLRGAEGPPAIRIADTRGRVSTAYRIGPGRYGFQGRPPGLYLARVESRGEAFVAGFLVPRD